MDDKTEQALADNTLALVKAQQVLAGLLDERKALLQPTTEEMHDAEEIVRECARDDYELYGMSEPGFLWLMLEQVELAREDTDCED